MFTYDFGYPWWLTSGHLIPLALFSGLLGVALWRGWPRLLPVIFALVVIWALASLVFLHQLRRPEAVPSDTFLASGSAHVLDVGAGSGRLTVGLLQSRPDIRVTALDIYSGFYGIEDNTPERLMANARAAGVADRLDWKVGDMRQMPFRDGDFDAVASSFAMDHVGREGADLAVRETARVLKPGGEFLLMLVNTDWWVRFASLLPHHSLAHPAINVVQWRSRLESSGFDILEHGTRPATMYFVSRKRGS